MSKQVPDLRSLWIQELKDLYSAETQIIDKFPEMIDAAEHDELKQLLADHLEQSKGHIDRLKGVFELLGEKPAGNRCQAMAGLLEEATELLSYNAPGPVKDAGLIAAAQRIEHYEMAGYGAARTFAQVLGETEAAGTLQATLNEEGKADHLLTKLAQNLVNQDAVNA